MEMDPQRDPLARQCLPEAGELADNEEKSPDPLEEETHMPVPHLVHRYENRCLILATSLCAVHCRHCNRKRQWERSPWVLDQAGLDGMVAYVMNNPAIREVIISGGDPLTLTDRHLDEILGAFCGIPHVEVLRIGTRAPAVLPMRITARLCRILKKHRPLWLNTQFNHLRELTAPALRACEMLLQAGIPISSQTVFLRNVNDNYESMRDLVHGLQRAGVRPYYLFQADNVAGTSVYRADPLQGRQIIARLRQSTGGLCIPRYVEDRPGRRCKQPLDGEDCLPPRDGEPSNP
jgi:lysine 2,3-aminomutase